MSLQILVKMGYKQVLLVRQDLKLPKGKMAVQVAHASSAALMRSPREIVKKWELGGMKKIVLKVENLDDIYRFKEEAEDIGLVATLISDAGKTVVEPGTITCLGIGPDNEEKIDKVTGKLKMV
jgi:PTH2 family peptidyl-tRNA hydrolase